MGLADQVMGMLGGKGGLDIGDLGGVAQNLLGKDSPIGGLDGILGKLKGAGLEDQVQSWIGTGENKAISADQVKQALGPDEIKTIAEKAGVSEDKAASGLAQMLPQIVDKVSPDGNLPGVDQLDDVLKKVL